MHAPIRLVRNVELGRLLDTFMVSAIVTILITRLYLELANYPQVGNDVLHIAHLLPGGLLMLLAITVLLGTITRSARDFAALIGGIGFGLFWDELGKFITKDNDYFFEPTAGLIYLSFILFYLGIRLAQRRTYTEEDYLANAIDVAKEGAIKEMDPKEYALARRYLSHVSPEHALYAETAALLNASKPTKKYSPLLYDRIVNIARRPFLWLARQAWFRQVLTISLGLYATVSLAAVLYLTVDVLTADGVREALGGGVSRTGIIATIGSLAATTVIAWGMLAIVRRHKLTGYRRIESGLLINIFVTQVFLFFENQFSASVGLVVTIAILSAIRVFITEERLSGAKS
jgi:hypothetical protein